jgi:hemerythrin-like domain-containing protein
MIIERLSQEHRNIEKLLAILERELEVFDRGDRPDYEVFAGLSAISKSTRKCITIPRKT